MSKVIIFSGTGISAPSYTINDKLYSKVIYKSADKAIDEIAIDIENFLSPN